MYRLVLYENLTAREQVSVVATKPATDYMVNGPANCRRRISTFNKSPLFAAKHDPYMLIPGDKGSHLSVAHAATRHDGKFVRTGQQCDTRFP
jgi:hypothetical protein